ncbi:hypothetical protein HCUR_00054 [Holospora curviuscula]|uniref:Uncharacterized protein n=1 Tax=Holospora curviuscula TaxID=1082868 RepID=A0A2S5RHX2_9PROT|nr:hypothetical protein HCUR_00054 [Holospora curviuscula]
MVRPSDTHKNHDKHIIYKSQHIERSPGFDSEKSNLCLEANLTVLRQCALYSTKQ